MARTVAAVFDDQIAAERAIERARDLGLPDDAVTTVVVNPPGMHHGTPIGGDEIVDREAREGGKGALKGAAIGGAAGVAAGIALAPLVGPAAIPAAMGAGAYVGSLAGAGSAMGDENETHPTARPGGVMVAVNVDRGDEAAIIEAFRANQAKLIEIAEGQWLDGKWVDFDPVAPPRHVVDVRGNPNYPTDTKRAGEPQPRRG
jgi:hypothetical protein